MDENIEAIGAMNIMKELRKSGWTVAIHNDYRLRGKSMTFWLWTHELTGRYIKGEGETDAEALCICATCLA